MENQKVRFGLTKRNKKVIQVIGCGVLAITSVYGAHYILKNIYVRGLRVGAVVSFQETINWFDKEFPDIKLRELYNGWAELHPEQIVTVKI